MEKDKVKEFLGVYAKILLIIFAFTILFNIVVIFFNPSTACYERIEEVNVIKIGDMEVYNDVATNTSCKLVSVDEYNKINNSIKRIGWISAICLIGYIIIFLIERIQK